MLLQEVLSSQGLLEKEASWRKILGFLPDETLRAELHASWAARRQAGTPEVNVLRWQQLEHEVAKVTVQLRSPHRGWQPWVQMLGAVLARLAMVTTECKRKPHVLLRA